MRAIITLAGLILTALLSQPANADLVTELGGGYKFQSSFVLSPDCRRVATFDPTLAKDGTLVYNDLGWPITTGETVPCGGDNPIAILWPLAWDFPDGNTRIGWFHMSAIFDGKGASGMLFPGHGDAWEATFDCLCAKHTFHWGRRRGR